MRKVCVHRHHVGSAGRRKSSDKRPAIAAFVLFDDARSQIVSNHLGGVVRAAVYHNNFSLEFELRNRVLNQRQQQFKILLFVERRDDHANIRR